MVIFEPHNLSRAQDVDLGSDTDTKTGAVGKMERLTGMEQPTLHKPLVPPQPALAPFPGTTVPAVPAPKPAVFHQFEPALAYRSGRYSETVIPTKDIKETKEEYSVKPSLGRGGKAAGRARGGTKGAGKQRTTAKRKGKETPTPSWEQQVEAAPPAQTHFVPIKPYPSALPPPPAPIVSSPTNSGRFFPMPGSPYPLHPYPLPYLRSPNGNASAFYAEETKDMKPYPVDIPTRTQPTPTPQFPISPSEFELNLAGLPSEFALGAQATLFSMLYQVCSALTLTVTLRYSFLSFTRTTISGCLRTLSAVSWAV